MPRKVQKTLFRDVTKVENFDDESLITLKKRQKSAFGHFRFGSLKLAVKGLKSIFFFENMNRTSKIAKQK
jgi:hypothetical protein